MTGVGRVRSDVYEVVPDEVVDVQPPTRRGATYDEYDALLCVPEREDKNAAERYDEARDEVEVERVSDYSGTDYALYGVALDAGGET